jgi:hypothetical protein
MRRSQPAICCGDQRCRSRVSTTARSLGRVANFDALGRSAAFHAAVSARTARYRCRPPLRFTSRVTVDGARPSLAAIPRHDSPAARPREMSSRSASDSCLGERTRDAGLIPPAL